MLHHVLNSPALDAGWHLNYGIKSRRLAALLADRSGRNSFANPFSETALTLFMLGNIDGWKQLTASPEVRPRSPQHEGWDTGFFTALRRGPIAPPAGQNYWGEIGAPPFGDRLDFSRSVLLFEFEVMNSAFNSINGGAFKYLSFLDMRGNPKWGAFDAFLIIPPGAGSGDNRGTLIGFEAKLNSDISRHTEIYRHVNQIMRNLEAGFWLTHHEASRYSGWDFQYVFIAPRLEYDLQGTHYSWLLSHLDEALTSFRRVIERHLGSEPTRYDEFTTWARTHTCHLDWGRLATALGWREFGTGYLLALGEHNVPAEFQLAAIQRFGFAGIAVP